MSNKYPPKPNETPPNPYLEKVTEPPQSGGLPPYPPAEGMPPYPPYMKPPLVGLGGWLACFQVYMYYILVSFFFTVPSYLFLMWMHNNPESFDSIDPSISTNLFAIYGEKFMLMMTTGIIVSSISFVWLVINLVFFYKRKKILPRLMIAYFLFELASTVVTMLMISNVGVFSTITTIISIAIVVAWIFYFMRSVRVKNTFIR